MLEDHGWETCCCGGGGGGVTLKIKRTGGARDLMDNDVVPEAFGEEWLGRPMR